MLFLAKIPSIETNGADNWIIVIKMRQHPASKTCTKSMPIATECGKCVQMNKFFDFFSFDLIEFVTVLDGSNGLPSHGWLENHLKWFSPVHRTEKINNKILGSYYMDIIGVISTEQHAKTIQTKLTQHNRRTVFVALKTHFDYERDYGAMQIPVNYVAWPDESHQNRTRWWCDGSKLSRTVSCGRSAIERIRFVKSWWNHCRWMDDGAIFTVCSNIPRSGELWTQNRINDSRNRMRTQYASFHSIGGESALTTLTHSLDVEMENQNEKCERCKTGSSVRPADHF